MSVGDDIDNKNLDEKEIKFSRYDEICNLVTNEPPKFNNAITGTNSEQWKVAIQEELDAHQENQTWKIVDRPSSGTTLTARWVFVIKRRADGSIDRFEARLVARGFEQIYGIYFLDTFAPVARIETVRIVLSISAVSKLVITQFDVSTAFLNGVIEENIYMEPP